MKFSIYIDKAREEEVIVYAHERSALTDEIERVASKVKTELVGYNGKAAVRLDENDVVCFTVEGNRVYAVCNKEKLQLKCRLYQLEDTLGMDFVKINQSCIANIKKISRFDASISGSLKVIFKNGYCDYVSRRQVKNVKERLGL